MRVPDVGLSPEIKITDRARSLFDAGTVAVLTLVTLLIAVRLRGLYYDDCAITFRIARNFADGRGLVYNPGERYQASSAPGYALLLGLFARWVGSSAIPALAYCLSFLGLWAIGVAIYELCRRHARRIVGALSALGAICSPLVWIALDNEILPEIALILWALVFSDLARAPGYRGYYVAAALIGVATLFRSDAVLAIVPLVAAFAMKERRAPLGPALLYVAIVAPSALAAWTYYGRILPDTMALKQARYAAEPHRLMAATYVRGVADGLTGHANNQWAIHDLLALYGFLGLFALFVVFRRRDYFLLPVLLWIGMYAAFYGLIYKVYEAWYTAPIGLGISLICAIGLSELIAWARQRGSEAKTATILAVSGAALFQYLSFIEVIKDMDETQAFGRPTILVILGLYLVVVPLAVALVVRRFWPRLVALPPSWFTPLAFAAAAVGVLEVGGMMYQGLRQVASFRTVLESPHYLLYADTGKWLRGHVREGASVGYLEIGIIGWEAPNVRILDPLGLGSPGMMKYMRVGDWVAGPVREHEPDILIGHPVLTPGVFERYYLWDEWKRFNDQRFPWWTSWFHAHYRLIPDRYYRLDYGPREKVLLYARRDKPLSELLRPDGEALR